MKNVLPLFVLTLLFFQNRLVTAQDIQFSQFYATSTYLNPGLAGTKIVDRVVSHSRLQWPSLDANYMSTMLAYDRAFHKTNSSIGAYMIYDRQGQNTFNTQEIQFQYAYAFNPTKKVCISTGAQLGVLQKKLNNTIVFPDQMDLSGQIHGAISADDNLRESTSSIDIGIGTVIYTSRFWLGLSGLHLNKPRQSFLFEDNRLPVKYIIASGYRFPLKKNIHSWITPTLQYKSQGKSDQFELGAHGTFDRLLTGIWYRGIPPKKHNDLRNHESAIVMVGYKVNKHFQISYSYDAVISGLSGISAGAHEIHIEYPGGLLSDHQKSMRKVICPPKLSR